MDQGGAQSARRNGFPLFRIICRLSWEDWEAGGNSIVWFSLAYNLLHVCQYGQNSLCKYNFLIYKTKEIIHSVFP